VSPRFATLLGLDGAYGDLTSATVFLSIEHDLLTLDQPTHSGALKRGSVNKDVGHLVSPLIRRDIVNVPARFKAK
jgi:hypothetical protein